jgi:hypothetical protein
MNTSSSTELRGILMHPTRGVIGLVDDLLKVCQAHRLQLDWQADRYRLRPFMGEWEEIGDVSLRKSVLRAILARVAALCNERTPNSVSPYGGSGEVSVGGSPRAICKVTFTNTLVEQKLELVTETAPENTQLVGESGERATQSILPAANLRANGAAQAG